MVLWKMRTTTKRATTQRYDARQIDQEATVTTKEKHEEKAPRDVRDFDHFYT